VYKGRRTAISVGLGYDVSSDTFSSQIRDEPERSASLLATWTITFLTDGTDGELVLTLPASQTTDVEESGGWMDLKRVSGGEPFNVWDDPVEVLFKEPVTD